VAAGRSRLFAPVPAGFSPMTGLIKRRDVLKAGVTGALALALRQKTFAAEPPQRFRIGIAATEWLARDHSVAGYWKAAEAISALGVGATEADNGDAQLDSAYGAKPLAFRQLSQRAGVRLLGVYQAMLLHDRARLPEMLAKIRSDGRFLKAIGAEYIALGWDPPSAVDGKAYERTPQDLRQAIRAANEIGRISLEENGIVIAFHGERDIPKEMILELLEGTDPKYVRFCADVGHLTAAGLDAVEVVKTYSSRLAVSHWKDFDPRLPGPSYLGNGAKGDFVEVGQGIVDFPGLAKLYRQIGFTGWVMLELDQTRMPGILVSTQGMKAYVTDKLRLRFYPPQHA
jgi:inosose dehydratase